MATISSPRSERLAPRALLQYYTVKFATEIALQFAYRAAILIWLVSLVTFPLISVVVWRTVAESQGGAAGGFTAGEYAAYFIILMVVNQLTFSWHMWEMEWRIRQGFFSPILLRPMHPIHNDIAENMTFKLLTLVPLLPVTVIFSVVFDAEYTFRTGHLVAFVPALVLAMGLRFILEWTIGLLAFWITKTSSINQLFSVVFLFLGGQFAPLALLPDAAQVVAAILPFRWALSFPVELAMGTLETGEIVRGLALQIAWIAGLTAAMHVVWKRAVRRYSAVGA